MNANEVCPWTLMRKCLLAMLILMLVILMPILMLHNLKTGYADTDADLCIRIISLCCINSANFEIFWKKDESMVMQKTMLSIGVGQASIKRASLLDTYKISTVHIKILRNEFNSYPLCKYSFLVIFCMLLHNYI